MTGLSVLLFGLGLGLRHAADADHVVVVSALVQREPGVWRAARIAALWGAGHSAAFLGLGFLIVLAEVRLPSAFERGAELLVALMLIGFGAWHLLRRRVTEASASGVVTYARPVVIGIVHGLAGSATIALLAATTIRSRAWASAYLALFGVGTVLGMVLMTVALSRPLGWSLRRGGLLQRVVTVAAALFSVALGASIVIRNILAESGP